MVQVIRGMLLHQPWANLVVEGIFPVLIRGNVTNIRGAVAVVAHGRDNRTLVDGRLPDEKLFPDSALVGYICLMGCERVRRRDLLSLLRERYGKRFADFYPRHYIPDKPTVFLWILAKPKLLQRPRRVPIPRSRLWVRISPQRKSNIEATTKSNSSE